jgi:hypothetical protein
MPDSHKRRTAIVEPVLVQSANGGPQQLGGFAGFEQHGSSSTVILLLRCH